MALCNNNSKFNCILTAIIASVVIGIVTAFLQITGVITVTPVFLWIVFGIAVVYLAILVATAAFSPGTENCDSLNSVVNTLLIGILGSILFAIILLAVGVVATSPLSAILSGLLLLFFSLTITSSACLVRCLFGVAN